ncbi:MAG: T9SS type A sorting domain-containing protein, partial [Flavobacteriales bacterium]|nr:T9SS type A sorting domain-containing protein [Flavobacteriales bacterium]
DVITAACVCAGTPDNTDTDGDGIADCADNCPTLAGQQGDACNDNDACTTNDVITAACVCAGTPDNTDTDGDGIADCADNCPTLAGQQGDACNDNNACTNNDVITTACLCAGTPDNTDTDGDGIADCADNCPTLAGQQGDACNDFNTCTLNDVITAACVCAGTPNTTDTDLDGVVDCQDNCPFVAGQIGSTCDDGNANTINDVLSASCVCTGTPVGGCTQNEVTLTLTTDANGAQTSYEVVLTGTSTVVCSGAGYASSSTITATCCLPNGCYDLRVFDSAGDGIAAPGGYVLRDANNKRIIDNDGNGATFTSSSISPLGFCVPLGSGALDAASCDVLTATPTTVLHATLIPGVTSLYSPGTPTVNANTGYQFWVTNPNGGYSRRILFTHASPGAGWPVGTPAAQKASYFRLNAMSSAPTIPLGVLLNVRVRSLVNGTYGVFGPACRLLLPVPPCQPSQLTTTADPVASCGATGLTLTSTIYATPVTGATSYQFEFSKAGYLRRITLPTRQAALNFITAPLQNNNCYDVRVRVTTDGGITFCPFGPTCTITIGNATCGGSAMAPHADDNSIEDIALSTRLSIWPNPNDGSQLHLSLSDLDGSVSTVAVDVTDAYGKLVLNSIVPVQDGLLNSSIDLQQDLAPGLYLVNLQAGDQRFTERLVIQ